jgi:outer membrane protein assembly factor BamB
MIFVAAIGASHLAVAEDWNQWRGSQRDGVVRESPALIEELPEDGLAPAWVSERIPSGGEGGWGSPVVASGRVYLFAHTREQVRELGPPRFPALTEEEQKSRSPEELAEYERQRSEEEKQRRAEQFRYREQLYCLDAESGQALWVNRSDSMYTQVPQSGSPTVHAGRVYILGAGRRVRCIDAAGGDDLWETVLPGAFEDQHYHCSVVALDGVVLATADRLFGVEAASGEIAWESSAEQAVLNHSSPAVWSGPAGNFAIVSLEGGWTGCFDPHDGRELWRVQAEASAATPVVAGDRLITYGDNRKAGLRCFEMTADGAEELWVYHGLQDRGSSPAVVDEHVYVQGESRVACVELATGDAAWTDELDLSGPQYTSLAVADGKVFYAYESLNCWAADSSEFRLLYDGRFTRDGTLITRGALLQSIARDSDRAERFNAEEADQALAERLGNPALGCASPAICDGRIYIRLQGCVACYDLTADGEITAIQVQTD